MFAMNVVELVELAWGLWATIVAVMMVGMGIVVTLGWLILPPEHEWRKPESERRKPDQ